MECPRLARYGTLARLEDCEALSPSLLKVRTVGTQRFELLSAKQEKGGLWMGEVRLLDDDQQVAVINLLLILKLAQ